MIPTQSTPPAGLDTDFRTPIRKGLWLVILGFGGFMAWASLAPLDEGVPAPGAVAVETKRKQIDHPAGGVVEKILVRDGQRVSSGQDLILLNETQARAALNATLGQWYVNQATMARLMAEQEHQKTIAFPKELVDAAKNDPVARNAINVQDDLFRSRRLALEGELRIIYESKKGLEEQVASLTKLKGGREKQINLFNEQLNAFTTLNQEGFVSRNYLTDIERQLAEVQSRQSEDLSNIAGVNAKLSEYRMRGSQREIEFRRDVESQLTDIQREAATLNERLAAQRDTVERLSIKAPVDGVVVDLAMHTIGGTIKPGERVMDIVPQGDRLVIQAQVPVQQIDRVRAGLPADVHFDAYTSRARNPMVKGSVETVSADALTDPHTGAPYYRMEVSVPPEELKALGDVKIQPGMPSTVIVKTGERPLMVYLLRPLLRRFQTAFTD